MEQHSWLIFSEGENPNSETSKPFVGITKNVDDVKDRLYGSYIPSSVKDVFSKLPLLSNVYILIEGNSRFEDPNTAIKFYEWLISTITMWVNFDRSDNYRFTLVINIGYFNSQSSKLVLETISGLYKNYPENIQILWVSSNEDMIDTATTFKDIITEAGDSYSIALLEDFEEVE